MPAFLIGIGVLILLRAVLGPRDTDHTEAPT
jgi:hypothetical protein